MNARHTSVMMTAIWALCVALSARADDRPSGETARMTDVPAETSKGFLAVVVPRRAVNVAAPRDGLLESVEVSLGQVVAEGDTLLTLSDQMLRHDLGIAQAELKVAQGTRNKAAINVERATDRVTRTREKPEVFSPNEVKDAEFELQLVKQELQIADTRIDEQQKRIGRLDRSLEQSVVTAPFSGTISARFLDPGMRLAAHTSVVRLISNDDLLVRFGVPRDVADNLGPGHEITFASEDGWKRAHCVVTHVAPEIDAALRLVVVEASPVTSGVSRSGLQPGLSGFVTVGAPPAGQPTQRESGSYPAPSP